MKNHIIAIIVILFGIMPATNITPYILSHPVYAVDDATSSSAEDDHCVETVILGNGEVCDDGQGSSVYYILNLVVNIMTIGVGILGVIGITIVGIQYLTAGGNEEQTRKAKRRLLEIILGLAFYVAAYVILAWLNPSFTTLGS